MAQSTIRLKWCSNSRTSDMSRYCMIKNVETPRPTWIRVVGLPLHLWTGEILKKVGDSCGGFVALDEETSLKTDLHWARILVKMNSTKKPSSVNLLAGARSYKLQIWWEIQPTVAEVFP